jgi:hypothetical protein
MYLRFWLQRLALVSLVSAGVLLSSTSAFAAERVVLKYRIFSESIPVKELSTFAETGELSKLLRVNLNLARQDPKVVRYYLTEPVKVNLVLLDRLLNNPLGNVVLDEVSQVIHTPSRQTDRQALRSALILSARSDNNITLIETIQNYPTAVVQVEADQLERAYRQLSRLEGRLQNLLDKLRRH